MQDKTAKKIGRLAMRHEGPNWNAYYALPDTMEDAIFLGGVVMRLVNTPERRDRFIACMREFVSDLIEEEIGTRPIWPEGPHPAPESERAGHG